jgi:hypothetical protein
LIRSLRVVDRLLEQIDQAAPAGRARQGGPTIAVDPRQEESTMTKKTNRPGEQGRELSDAELEVAVGAVGRNRS